ncbi:Proton/sodium-glutamate symport protein [Poriferisphaera corsica]|uniref:Proton/sodium-glutamate symport protein n=1 Tax=Poriferisphaera corsica TaxID=2528020 RepID=A0A517YY89_9BACT|nr:dicarboxylate/amino acid:cation symporter [Poriferisphaera corsica]QDU35167.1 Proton/sodium-glutamate symport protein [Poriferisphaera corsica]
MSDNKLAEKKPVWAIWHWALHWQILIGLILGAALGLGISLYYIGEWKTQYASELAAAAAAGQAYQEAGIPGVVTLVDQGLVYMICDLIGDIFLNALKLVVIPLVTSSIIVSIIGIGKGAGFRRIGLKTLSYYAATSLVSILIGLTLVNTLKPGVVESGALLTSENIKQFGDVAGEMNSKLGGSTASDFLDVFRKLVPDNLITAATTNNLLGLIVVSLFVGYLVVRIKPEPGEVLTLFFDGMYRVSIRLTNIILRFAPIGILFLIAATMMQNYAKLSQEERLWEFGSSLVLFAFTVIAALAVHMFIVLPIFLWIFTRVNPYRHHRAMAPALLTAFSTASSSATLPVTMECVEQRAGVSRKTSSFVLPLGATVNMDGSALYECVAAIFVIQAFGWQLDLAQQFFIVIVALLTSIGVAGVPSASLVAIIVILQAIESQLASQGINLPLVAGFPILLIFDRPLDMCRTAVNIFSDSIGATIIAKTEGEEGLLRPELLQGHDAFEED